MNSCANAAVDCFVSEPFRIGALRGPAVNLAERLAAS
jgi:hypothetical protein